MIFVWAFFFTKQVKVMQRRSGQGGTFLVHSVQTNVSGKNFWLTWVQLICTILTTLSLSFNIFFILIKIQIA